MQAAADNQQRQSHPMSDTLSRMNRHNTPIKTPLPLSSPASKHRHTPVRSPAGLRNASSSNSTAQNPPRPSPSPLHRSLSSASIEQRASSPALLNRRPSTTSLRNTTESPAPSPRLGSRRSSANLLSQLMPAVEEPVVLTADIVAAEYFARELAAQQQQHEQQNGVSGAGEKTVVIIHDDCYGHRFSRLKTKDAIQSIFERPERVQASVMGISAAYVRLGEQHGEVIAESHRNREIAVGQQGKRRPFRIIKSSRKVRLHSDIVTAVHGKEWMKELQGLCSAAGSRIAAATNELERTSSVNGTKKESFHIGDLYLCDESINALEGALGGVCDAVDAVFQGSIPGSGPTQAFACVRPPGHHCSSDWPSGFCWLNNVHVGIQHAIQTYGLTHAAIIDFDLHHGDGSQEITWAHNERMQFPKTKNFPNSKKSFLGYFSIHDINSFPCELGDREKTQMASLCIDNAHGQAIWNVHLEQWQRPEEFWELYETRYKVILDKVRKFLRYRTSELRSWKNAPVPKAAIFISAGFDASEHEVSYMQRHSVNVMTEFYARFTKDIADLANEDGTGVGGRIISVLEGGYSDKALVSGVLSHISGLCDGHPATANGTNVEQLTNGFGSLGISGLPAVEAEHTAPPMKYSNEWWHESSIDTLVHLLHPSGPAADKNTSKKPRNASYSSPTHSSVMKAVDPNRVLANAATAARLASANSRAITPPIPEVDWATAASELCKLLIPQDRQIDSHTQMDLNPPKDVKIKKEIQFEPPQDASALNGRALRERKPRASMGQDAQLVAARSRKASIDRRKTIADVPLPSIEPSDKPKEPRRRTSIASTVSAGSAVPPMPPVPRPAQKVSPVVEIKKSRASTSTASSRQSSVKPAAKQQSIDSDMDSLTSGLQRIKIKVPSTEEYQARKVGPAAVKTNAVAARKPPVPKAAKTAAPAIPKKSLARDPMKLKATAVAVPPAKDNAAIVQPVTQQSAAMPKADANLAQNGSNHTIAPTGVGAAPNDTPDQSANHQSSTPTVPAPTQKSSPPVSSRPAIQSPSESSYTNLQWATPNADIAKEATTTPPQPSTTYEAGLQWMPPNSDAGYAPAPASASATKNAAPANPTTTVSTGASAAASANGNAAATATPPLSATQNATTTATMARPQKSTPVFSATGHIPFAGASMPPPPQQQQQQQQ